MTPPYQSGLDTLLRNHTAWLRGRRVGLVAHPASVDAAGRHAATRLAAAAEVNLVALFGAEHGFLGQGGAGEVLPDGHHATLGLPIHSLYGRSRRPSRGMMESCDVVVYDLQDVTARCYTYVSTLRYLLEAAARWGKRVVVADRPAALPDTVDGPLLGRGFTSFVGAIPAPLVYGMTPGETARWLVKRLGLNVDLRVAPMRGYHRQSGPAFFDERWLAPSPAIRCWQAAAAYTSTVFTEALPAWDCARSERQAFQVLRGKKEDAATLADFLNAMDLPGVFFHPHRARGHQGVRLAVTAPALFRPVTTGYALLHTLGRLHGRIELWQKSGARPAFFDQLMGTDRVRKALVRGDSVDTVAGRWERARRCFMEERDAALLYRKKPGKARRTPSLRRREPPRRAVVLAAGLGTRLRPLTRVVPKALLPLWGKPMLQHTLEQIADWGVRDVVVNTHHLAADVVRFLSRAPVPGLRISISHEPVILGTGGALRKLAWFLDEQPFWLVNADVAAALDPTPLLEAFHRPHTAAALWMHAQRGPRTVTAAHGWVTNFRAPRPGAKGTLTFCGLHLLTTELLQGLSATGFASIIPAYEQAIQQGRRVAAVTVPGAYWADIGTPAQYLSAHEETRQRAATGRNGGALYDPAADHSGSPDQPFTAGTGPAEKAPRGRCVLLTGPVTARVDARGVSLPARVGLDGAARSVVEAAGFAPARCMVEALGERRGSARSFTRVHAPRRRALLVRYDPARKENRLYAGHARFLRTAGFPVPEVYHDAPAEGMTLFEDLGRMTLEEKVNSTSIRKSLPYYERVVDAVAHLHHDVTREARTRRLRLMPRFTHDLFAWEADLFIRHFLREHGPPGRRAEARVRAAFRNEVAAHLLRQPQVLLHRDLQSSNILLKRGRPFFIDFQGMRYGPASYDLASLLGDPYVALPLETQEKLLADYATRAGSAQVVSTFWLATVQRLSQALGAFGRIEALDPNSGFGGYVAPALAGLKVALERSGACRDLQTILKDITA